MSYQRSDAHIANFAAAKIKSFIKRKEDARIKRELYHLNSKLCERLNCSAIIPYDKRSNRFCSKTCAAINNNPRKIRSVESRLKTSNSLKGKKRPNVPTFRAAKFKSFYEITRRICPSCNKGFYIKGKINQWSKKTCSKECRVIASVAIRKYQNGSRKPILYFNPFENKEIWLDSSWEKEIADLLIEKNIKWIRPNFIRWIDSQDKKHLYYPDFFLPDHNIYLDPKNPYCMQQDIEKMSIVSKTIDLKFGSLEYIKEIVISLWTFVVGVGNSAIPTSTFQK
jgi:hypothetical protein